MSEKKDIVKEIVIDAPVAKVWRHLTDPALIAGWLMQNDFDPRVGRPFTMDCNEQGKIACVVKEVDPQKRLVYTFQSKVTQVETTVTITLTAEGKATRVKLVHTGWEKLPPPERGVRGGFDQGWGKNLAKLRERIQGANSQ